MATITCSLYTAFVFAVLPQVYHKHFIAFSESRNC